MNHQEIAEICKKYNIKNYTINLDGSIDVDGDVSLCYDFDLTKLPLNFNIVTGDFKCTNNKLTSLKGCPKKVGRNFICHDNKLTSLEGCPTKVGGDYFDCHNNKLTSLKGCPSEVVGNFNCDDNLLTSLEGCPKKVGGHFDCRFNQLVTLKGCPQKVGGDFSCWDNKLVTLEGCPQEVGGDFVCAGNKIYDPYPLRNFETVGDVQCTPFLKIYKLFGGARKFKNSLEWDYVRKVDGEWCIIKSKFKRALKEAGKELPESVEGYKYI